MRIIHLKGSEEGVFMVSSEEMNLTKKNIPDKIMKEVSLFPSVPQTGFKLRALLHKGDAPMTEIEEILRHDPGLSANVLRVANSAFFGLSTKVGSLKQAVMLLGIERFAQIAVSASMEKTMKKAIEGYSMEPGELWLHSIAASNIAEFLAKNRKIDGTYDVFTSALLHDIGKLVLSKFLKEELQNIKNITENAVPLDVAEQMVLGTDHAEIGALILSKWLLPIDIVNAVRWHHSPELKENSNIKSDIVYLSNQMCQSNTNNDIANGHFAMPSSAVLQRLVIKFGQYKAMAKKAKLWMEKLSGELTFD
jgi:putative nucleotidyltransferase with HDIG domain